MIADARDINPQLAFIEVSSTHNIGIDEWCEWLIERVREKQDKKAAARII